ncbi:serine hydrolase domain-containing protein [Planotetraspora phitsanulokensis]|uniref:Peptidase n=1 Tax=Planotetraspora phitsanulokensis TaxID=575192 RepID=A0A8J3XFK6_9ACTN|nr:serine hydrolase domain-containing protein [Planotetraspora phitsanulokensis]GII39802.1 peptidase [Planotetraspora phitsanulokensis]
MFKPVAAFALTAALAGSALAGTASPVAAAATKTPTTSAPTCSAATRPESASSLRPLNARALCQSIAGLPNSQATGALVQVRGTAGSWTGKSGVGDLRTGRPVPDDARIRIGSITKVFTATVVLQFVAEGKVDLDGTVQHYLPGLLPANYPPVTVGELLDHTSGLPSPTLPEDDRWILDHRYDKWTPQQWMDGVAANPMEFEPGTRQHYLNTNYIVLGMLIEKLTGRPYADAVRTRIIRPLGLRHTTLPVDDVRIHGPHAKGYLAVTDDDGKTRLVDVTEMSQTMTWAAGEIISTTDDLDRFMVALFRGRLLKPAQLEKMFTVPDGVPLFDGDDDPSNDQPAAYTMGMSVMTLPGGVTVYGKTGSRYGYSTGMFATRDLKRRIVVTVNSTTKGDSTMLQSIGLTAFAS